MKHEKQTETEGFGSETEGFGSMRPDVLRHLAGDAKLMEIGRKAVENELVEWRDNTRFMLRNNGLTIRNKDGSESSIVRFGPEVGVAIALRAIAEHLETKAQNGESSNPARTEKERPVPEDIQTATTPPGCAPTNGSEGMAALAMSVVCSLQFLHCRGSGILLREGVAKHWTEHFCDSLEEAGYEVDRAAVRKYHKLLPPNAPDQRPGAKT